MFHKFWMVVRDNGTSSCTKRWQDIQEAREEAMRLCRKERVPFVVLEAMERISLEEKETPVKIERLCDVPAKTYTKEEILAEFLKVPEEEREIGNMDDLKQLIGKKLVTAGEASIRMIPMEGRDSYLVEVVFPLDSFKIYCSKWVNPMRCALEAAEEALNELKCACYAQELEEGKPYEKPVFPVKQEEP